MVAELNVPVASDWPGPRTDKLLTIENVVAVARAVLPVMKVGVRLRVPAEV